MLTTVVRFCFHRDTAAATGGTGSTGLQLYAGLGGGSAGGSNGTNSAGVNVSGGGKGGDGVVILRWSDPIGTIILIK